MVNRDIVEKALETVRVNVNELRRAKDIDWNVYISDVRARRFVERSLHVIIEACIDAAHHIISDGGMREPATYREAFVVLCENDVLPKDALPAFEKIAMFRNLLVHYYEKIDDEIVYSIFKNGLDDFDRFVGYVLDFLNKNGEC